MIIIGFMAGKVQLKIIVAPTKRCVNLLRYIVKHLDDLAELKVRIFVIEAPTDPAKLKQMTKQGITSTPTLIGNDGKVVVGETKIYGLLNANLRALKEAEAAKKKSMQQLGYGGVQDYWMQGLFSGIDREGRYIPRDDEDDEMGENPRNNFGNAMRDMESRRRVRGPRSKTRAPARRKSRREPEPIDDDDDEDFANISEEDDDMPPPPRGKLRLPPAAPRVNKNSSPAAMDQEMMDAWMDNNAAPAETLF